MRTITVDVEVGEFVVPVTLRALSPVEWARLIDDHPSGDPAMRWDPETFEPALLLASIASPELTAAIAARLADDPDTGGQLVALAVTLSRPDTLAWAKTRLARDQRLRLEMAFCREAGLSRSAFLAWDVRDQELALAHHESTTKVCPGCGVPDADMTDFDAWAPDARSCVHCMQLDAMRKTIPAEAASSTHVHMVRP